MIPVKNHYYMLAYVFEALQKKEYSECGMETFENASDMLSTILSTCVSHRVKRGLLQTYNSRIESLHRIKGRIDVSETVKRRTIIKKKIVCDYDDFTIDGYLNRILKTAMHILLRSDASLKNKNKIKCLLPYFNGVETIDSKNVNWNLQYNRNNSDYELIVNICKLVFENMIQTKDGNIKIRNFVSSIKEHELYEKFVLAYYKKHYPTLNPGSIFIKWSIDNESNDLLPVMKTDVTLFHGDKELIIDTKWYDEILKSHYSKKFDSANLYQIFSYVKNESLTGKTVSGMLLYADTGEEIEPDNEFIMSGNKISIKTLNLNQDFEEIKKRLNNIADEFIKS